jgi:multidrug efflux pump subunit AcrB
VSRGFLVVESQRRAIALGFAAILGLGTWIAFRLPSSILPDVTFPRIKVIADSGELPAAVMLRTVTIPLEAALGRIPHLSEMRSITSRGSVEINLDCEWGVDMDLALQRVQSQLDAVRNRLPDGTSLDARLMSPAQFPVLAYSLVSDRLSGAELRDLADFTLKPELSRLPGVAEVVVQGGSRLEARVTLDPGRLAARGLDAGAVAEAVRASARLESVGLLEANGRLYLGLADGRPRDLDELRAIPVVTRGGPPVTLGSLGEITLEEAPQFVRYRAQSSPAVLVSLLRHPSASVITLQQSTQRWLRDHRAQLPPGLRVQAFYDQSDLVRGAVQGARDSLLVGAVLAALIMIAFLGSLRLGAGGACVLPGSIALTLIGLSLTHQTLDMMSLGGIAAAIGLVLDDAIVVVEHLATHTPDGDAPARARAMAGLFPSLTGSTLCTLAIFLPFRFLGGVSGAFLRVLALSMSLMLASSYLLCLTVVPLLTRRAPARVRRSREGRWARLVGFGARHPAAGVAVVVVLVAAAWALQSTLPSGFLPGMDEGSLILDYLTPPGTSLVETDRMLREVDREIDATPEVIAWSRRTGDQLGFFITEPNTGDYVLRLRPGHRRAADEVADDLRRRIERREPAMRIEFGQLVEDVIGDLTSSPQPIEIRVFHDDTDLAQHAARDIAALLGRVRGVVDIKDGIVVSGPDATLSADPGAARLGVTTRDLADAVRPAVAGVDVGEIARGARAWDVRIVVPRPVAPGAGATLVPLTVPVADGQRVAVRDVARVRIDPGETEIARDDRRTMVPVTARLSGRDLGSAMREIQSRIPREVVLPAGAGLRFGGLWLQQQTSFRGLVLVLLAATLLVTLVLLIAFRSWGATLALLGVTLASLAGVFGALRVTGSTLDISSLVGAIMMVGIVSENGFFLVATYLDRRRAGTGAMEAAVAASRRRTRPILMTTLAGVAALTPLSLGLGAGSELLRPLAIAVIGGFTLSAVLLLMVLPSLLAGLGGVVDPSENVLGSTSSPPTGGSS